MARKFGANCSKCQRSTEQQQSIKCFKIHSKDLLQNNDFHITSSIFLLSSVLVFYFFLILFFNSIVYLFFIARIFGVLPEYFRDWGGCRPPRPPGSYAYVEITVGFIAHFNIQEIGSAICKRAPNHRCNHLVAVTRKMSLLEGNVFQVRLCTN